MSLNVDIAGSGAVCLAHIDRVYEEGLTTLLQRVASMNYGYEGRIEVHMIGGFADTKNVSSGLITATLSELGSFHSYIF